jgi:hypothetical protein
VQEVKREGRAGQVMEEVVRAGGLGWPVGVEEGKRQAYKCRHSRGSNGIVSCRMGTGLCMPSSMAAGAHHCAVASVYCSMSLVNV